MTANPTTTTRRAIMTGAVALPAMLAGASAAQAAAIMGSPVASPVAQLYAEYQAASEAFAQGRNDTTEDDEWERVTALQDRVLLDPINSPADAAAKVRLAALSLHEGVLASGFDADALAQVATWLEAL